MFPVEMARAQAQSIPGCRYETIEGTAHNSALEAPEKINPLVAEFLRALPADAA